MSDYQVGVTKTTDFTDRPCPYCRELIIYYPYVVVVFIDHRPHHLGMPCECCGMGEHVFSAETKGGATEVAEATDGVIKHEGADALILIEAKSLSGGEVKESDTVH